MDRAVISPDVGFDELLLQAPERRRPLRGELRTCAVVHIPISTACEVAILQVQTSGDVQLDFELRRVLEEALQAPAARPDAGGLWSLELSFVGRWDRCTFRWRRLVAVELLALEHGQPVFSAAVPWEPR